MIKLTDEEKRKISETVALMEKSSHGEILPLLIEQSDFYPAAHVRVQLLLALTFGFLSFLFFPHWEHPLYYLYAQFPGIILGYFLAYIPAVKRWMTTREERNTEVKQRAQEAFFTHGLNATKNRTGILIMLSLLERRIEILADTGISSRIPPETWVQLVQKLSFAIKRGQLADGLCRVILTCGELLAEKFPISESEKAQNKNELKNEIIIE